jgi:hypothetical protein
MKTRLLKAVTRNVDKTFEYRLQKGPLVSFINYFYFTSKLVLDFVTFKSKFTFEYFIQLLQ